MSWTVEEIERDWLGGSRFALAAHEDLVSTFNRVEEILGREWIEASRICEGSIVQGTAPTLRVVNMGQKLGALDGVVGRTDKLIERIRSRDQSAEAELTAIYLIRSRRPRVTVELYPKVGERKSDFRVRQNDESWTYVEVTKPDLSEAERRARTVLERITALLTAVKKAFALEVFLRREPNEHELELLSQRVPEICKMDGTHQEELPDSLGLLLLNQTGPGQVVLQNHPGEENRPRIGMLRVIVGPDEPHRHIAMRMAFADERAEAFLKREARQLPEDAPGLIMVQMGSAPGGFKSWEPLLSRRFQPSLHTRVSALCLFGGGLLATPKGEAWLPQTKLLINPHCRLALPTWIADAVREAGAEFERF